MLTIGIDEVGRGCWAGPLVAGAVVLKQPIPGLRDSKKLSKAQRETLSAKIYDSALAVGLGWVWPADIDIHGLTWAVKMAMLQAYGELKPFLIHGGYAVIVDGHINYLSEVPCSQALIRADDTVPAVSAASIIAKVARDQYMTTIDSRYPEYGFGRHVGYGTMFHISALKKFGITDIHRRSYKPIKAILDSN